MDVCHRLRCIQVHARCLGRLDDKNRLILHKKFLPKQAVSYPEVVVVR